MWHDSLLKCITWSCCGKPAQRARAWREAVTHRAIWYAPGTGRWTWLSLTGSLRPLLSRSDHCSGGPSPTALSTSPILPLSVAFVSTLFMHSHLSTFPKRSSLPRSYLPPLYSTEWRRESHYVQWKEPWLTLWRTRLALLVRCVTLGKKQPLWVPVFLIFEIDNRIRWFEKILSILKYCKWKCGLLNS